MENDRPFDRRAQDKHVQTVLTADEVQHLGRPIQKWFYLWVMLVVWAEFERCQPNGNWNGLPAHQKIWVFQRNENLESGPWHFLQGLPKVGVHASFYQFACEYCSADAVSQSNSLHPIDVHKKPLSSIQLLSFSNPSPPQIQYSRCWRRHHTRFVH